MKNKIKKQHFARYIFAFAIIIIGATLEIYNIGKEFFSFQAVGSWMIYVGFIMLAVITLQIIVNKKRIVDERMSWIAFKASRITFVLLILGAFIVMIADGIKNITLPYHLFMGYAMSYMMLVYFISYKILERYS
ncbi:MAG: DUF2178 domain-containing protein [Candidatus Pacearchaeota archaeon]